MRVCEECRTLPADPTVTTAAECGWCLERRTIDRAEDYGWLPGFAAAVARADTERRRPRMDARGGIDGHGRG